MGGCASKPKGLDTKKMPRPATRKPHAPPEVPVEKKDGDENKETTVSEPETSEVKAVNEGSVPVEVKPREAKVEAEEPLKERKVVAETVTVKEEKTEEAETVVPKEKKEEVAEKQDKEAVAAAQ